MRRSPRTTRERRRRTRIAWLAALAVGLASPAALALDDEEPPAKPRLVRAADLIPDAVLDKAEQYDVLMNFRIKKKHGIEYRQAVEIGDRKMSFGVYVPVVRKKTLGVGVEIRF